MAFGIVASRVWQGLRAAQWKSHARAECLNYCVNDIGFSSLSLMLSSWKPQQTHQLSIRTAGRREGSMVYLRRRQTVPALVGLLMIGCIYGKVGEANGDAAALRALAAAFPPNSAAGFAFSRLWNSSSSPCSWPGITCSPTSFNVLSISISHSFVISNAPSRRTSHIDSSPLANNVYADISHILSVLSPISSTLESLSLPSLNLSGSLPSPFPSFPHLSLLDLSYNNISGSIPASLCSSLPFLADLRLESNELTGSIPAQIAQCSFLTFLTLHDNQLSGPVPTSLGQLSLLEIFRVGGNPLLSGSLPIELSNCTHLTELGLAATSISGQIPSEYGFLSKLITFMAFDSNLSGSIPPQLGNCTQLVELHLFANHLTGAVPGELGKLAHLEKLYLWQNELSGSIPSELGGLTSIEALDLSQNKFSNSIPSTLGGLGMLSQLYLSANMLSGKIPDELGNCSMLRQLQLDRNLLTGQIPATLGKLSQLQQLFLWSNSLEGTLPSALGDCKHLQYLDLSWNRLSGPMPVNLFELKSLYKFLLLANEFTGVIPSAIAQSRALYRLRLGRNRFTGSIPWEIGELHNLTFLDVSNNQLSGPIPVSLAKCSALQLLDAQNNLLNGTIPKELSSLSNLQSLDISSNLISGSLPHNVGSLAQLTKFNVRSNSLTGLIPPELGNCKKLSSLDLSANSFFGSIPSSLGQISALSVSLNLSYNTLSGPIPDEFAELFALGDLDISHNKLSGNLDVLGKMNSLVVLNISYNAFSGPLPDAYIFTTLPVGSYAGNPGLYEKSRNTTAETRERSRTIVGFLLAIVAVMFLVGLMLLWRTIRHSVLASDRELNSMEWQWELTPFQKLRFRVEDVLEEMVEGNIIGKGGTGMVYRAEMAGGQVVAVKKMDAVAMTGRSGNKRLSRETTDFFTTEVEALRAVRHNNIVRLLGVCRNREVNLLLYEYMPNGSLGEYMHDKKGVLDWESRYKIALGAAQGLAYLHHDCVPPILHRDIKPNNILLGARLEPYLADFGLARFLLANNSSYPQTAIAGSCGYIAPEYGYTLSITDKSDVYSYGVVLLEILTGKRPLEADHHGRHLIDWVHEMRHCHHDVAEILDPRLRGMPDPFIREMLQMLAIAMACVHPLPTERPSMRHVVNLLLGIRHGIDEYSKVDVLAATTCTPRAPRDIVNSSKLRLYTHTSSMCSFTPPSCTSASSINSR